MGLRDDTDEASLLPCRLITPRERQRARELMQRFQQALRAVFQDHGWDLDRTADLARVQRLPGSKNWKGPDGQPDYSQPDPQPVVLLEVNDVRYRVVELEQRVPEEEPPHRLPAPDRPPLALATRSPGGYAQAVLRNQVEHLRRTPEGQRNDTLNRAAFQIGRLVDTGALGAADAENQLIDAALDTGLPYDEVTRTVASGLTAGRQRPYLFPVDASSGKNSAGLMRDIERRCQRAGEFLFRYDADEDMPLWGYDDRVLHISGEATMLSSKTGIGKSTLAQQLVLRRIGLISEPLLDLPVQPLEEGEVVLYIAADRPKQIRRSLHRMITPEDEGLLDRRMLLWKGPLTFLINRESTQCDALIQQMEAI